MPTKILPLGIFFISLLKILNAQGGEGDIFFFTKCDCLTGDGIFLPSETPQLLPQLSIDPGDFSCPNDAQRGIFIDINDGNGLTGEIDSFFFREVAGLIEHTFRFEFIVLEVGQSTIIPVVTLETVHGSISFSIQIIDGIMELLQDGIQRDPPMEIPLNSTITFSIVRINSSLSFCLLSPGTRTKCFGSSVFSNSPLDILNFEEVDTVGISIFPKIGTDIIKVHLTTLIAIRLFEIDETPFESIVGLPNPFFSPLVVDEDTEFVGNFDDLVDTSPFDLSFSSDISSLRGELVVSDDETNFIYIPSLNDNGRDIFTLSYTNQNEADLLYQCNVNFAVVFDILPIDDKLDLIPIPEQIVSAGTFTEFSFQVATSVDLLETEPVVLDAVVEIVRTPTNSSIFPFPCNETNILLAGDRIQITDGFFNFCVDASLALAQEVVDSFNYRVFPSNLIEDLVSETGSFSYQGIFPVVLVEDPEVRSTVLDEDTSVDVVIGDDLFIFLTDSPIENVSLVIEALPNASGVLFFQELEVEIGQKFVVGEVLSFVAAPGFFNANVSGGIVDEYGEIAFDSSCEEPIDGVCASTFTYKVEAIDETSIVTSPTADFHFIILAVDDENTTILIPEDTITVEEDQIVDGFIEINFSNLSITSDDGNNFFRVLIKLESQDVLFSHQPIQNSSTNVRGRKFNSSEVSSCFQEVCDTLEIFALPNEVNRILQEEVLLVVDIEKILETQENPFVEIFAVGASNAEEQLLDTILFSLDFLFEVDQEETEDPPPSDEDEGDNGDPLPPEENENENEDPLPPDENEGENEDPLPPDEDDISQTDDNEDQETPLEDENSFDLVILAGQIFGGVAFLALIIVGYRAFFRSANEDETVEEEATLDDLADEVDEDITARKLRAVVPSTSFQRTSRAVEEVRSYR